MDWVIIDQEHGPASTQTADALVHAIGNDSAHPMIRVIWNNMNSIKQALDTGAYGVIVPWVNTVEEDQVLKQLKG